MPRIFTLLPIFLSFQAGAQTQECKPEYKIQFEECAHPTHGTEAKNIETDWILVNKGARTVSEALCQEHIGTLQSQRPSAKNIRFLKMEDRDATLRGIGKRDVYCKYVLEDVVNRSAASAACGIKSVGAECFSGVTKDFVAQCANEVPQNEEAKWKKAGCLVDSLKNASQVQGLDSATYDLAKFQLRVLMESGDPKLSGWIQSQRVRLY